MSVSKFLDQKVRKRSKNRCDYCRMHQSLQGATFHVEHIVPSSLGGAEDLTNLVLACPSCNLHKSNRIAISDPDSGREIPLFHPLKDRWADHFVFRGFTVFGLTDCGKTTVAALHLNHPRRIRVREAETLFDLFPPD